MIQPLHVALLAAVLLALLIGYVQDRSKKKRP